MARTDRFSDVAQIREAKQRLRQERDAHKRRLLDHWSQLQDPDFRQGLVSEGLLQVLRGIPLLGTLRSLLTPDRASIGQALGMAFGASRKTRAGRIVGMIAAIVIPQILERYVTPERTERLFTEMRRSFRRIRERWRHRRTRAAAE
ncbi:MAG: hypothetical protein IPM46_11315 [Flavobacteriales bacterium]|nr:hypothetical protein [Flavobacteriales bacterium]